MGREGTGGIRRSQHEERTLELKPKRQERTRLAKLGDSPDAGIASANPRMETSSVFSRIMKKAKIQRVKAFGKVQPT